MVTTQPFAPDHELPQLALATQADAMRILIAKAFAMDVDRCVLSRWRYRRGERCVLQYQVALRDGTVTWVSALAYPPAQMADAWRKVQRRLAHLPGFESHVAYLDSPGLILQRFPFDWHLTTLPLALDAATNGSIAAAWRQYRDRGEMSSARNLAELSVTPIRYRAGLGAVLRLSPQTAPLAGANANTAASNRCHCFIKVYANDQGADTFRLLEQWRRSVTGLAAASPIDYFADLRALVLAQAEGESLENILIRGAAAEIESVMRRLAHALAALHANAEFRVARQHTAAAECANIRRAARYLCESLPERRDAISSLAQGVIDALNSSTASPCVTHRDLKLDHLFVTPDRITCIDLDSCAMADPLLDVALMLARLAAAPFLLPVRAYEMSKAADTFTAAYFERAPRASPERLAALQSGAVLDVASGFYRRSEPNWREAVAALVLDRVHQRAKHPPFPQMSEPR